MQFPLISSHKYSEYYMTSFKKTCHKISDFCLQQSQNSSQILKTVFQEGLVKMAGRQHCPACMYELPLMTIRKRLHFFSLHHGLLIKVATINNQILVVLTLWMLNAHDSNVMRVHAGINVHLYISPISYLITSYIIITYFWGFDKTQASITSNWEFSGNTNYYFYIVQSLHFN